MAFNLRRKKEVEQAKAMAHALHPDCNIPDSEELIALQNRYIYEEIDAKEYARLGRELELKELRDSMKERENNNQ
jgi:hypothetical protein